MPTFTPVETRFAVEAEVAPAEVNPIDCRLDDPLIFYGGPKSNRAMSQSNVTVVHLSFMCTTAPEPLIASLGLLHYVAGGSPFP
jgi:hypothetical protein